ncbi:MAG TPA: hypothetical protein VG015_06450 [Candidatus Dormibacteraeota bacterium]|jgi:hypothetical protein|nr:hypothetical protein [Candidatus Dormibacteraeota bacterium]
MEERKAVLAVGGESGVLGRSDGRERQGARSGMGVVGGASLGWHLVEQTSGDVFLIG